MIVIIDNYDSFTYNLVQYYKQLDEHVHVYYNDEVSVSYIASLNPTLIVLSPGPGSPDQSGVCSAILKELATTTPILGVCLGHQLICAHFGGNVVKGKQPMHGKVSTITHDGHGIFQTIPSPCNVTRYHSLVVKDHSIPAQLEVTARSSDGTIMGVRHRTLSVEGIQFHPESILTEHGFDMIKNSYMLALQWNANNNSMGVTHAPVPTF
ncbi:anthranilate synthase component II [Radiobacillus sp. PE A8.2]|uniref:anthranilate synthase component II n=1 Tax=Radiobacillus sp. PE A8.2 TaxID=3380349 RepID=UPI00388D075B